MSDGARPAPTSVPLPRVNPSRLVLDVQRLLGERGVTVVVDMGNANAAIAAASDLLRALGVVPTAAPGRV